MEILMEDILQSHIDMLGSFRQELALWPLHVTLLIFKYIVSPAPHFFNPNSYEVLIYFRIGNQLLDCIFIFFALIMLLFKFNMKFVL